MRKQQICRAVKRYWKKHPEKRRYYNRRSNARMIIKRRNFLKIYYSLCAEEHLQKYQPENILTSRAFREMINDSCATRNWMIG